MGKLNRWRSLVGGLTICISLVGCIEQNENAPSNGGENNNNLMLISPELGDTLFHDLNLSDNRTMSCATCHNPNHGFIDNRENLFNQSVSMGADGVKFGTRNTPTVAYAQFSPAFYKDDATDEYVGGQFHDGRAQHLTAQVNLNGGPILNPLEMMMSDRNAVVERLLDNPDYIAQFKEEFGEDIFSRGGNGAGNPAFSRIGQAIAAFEMTEAVSPFDSKFDRYLSGDYTLTEQEQRGYAFVQAHCMSCHDSSAITGADKQTFSNYRYYNLGVPVNQAVRDALGSQDKDPGLFGHPNVSDEAQLGKFKTPTLRNITITGPYMHNGVFQNLETVMAFKDYRRIANNNERVLNPETQANWGEPDYPSTVQYTGAEAMSDQTIADIVAFLKLLTDQRYEALLNP